MGGDPAGQGRGNDIMLPASGVVDLDAGGKDDSTDRTRDEWFRGFSFGVAGAVKITTILDQDITFDSGDLATGVVHPIRAKRVWSTGTTATGLFGYY